MLAQPEHGDSQMPGIAASGDNASGAFARAHRHSRRVRVLKFLLPLAGLAIVAAFVGKSYFAATPAEAPATETATDLEKGKLVMSNPNVQGFTNEKLPYSLGALRAVQSVTQEGVINLEKISAKLPIDSKRQATIEAPAGVFDQSTNSLTIDSAISVRTTDGMSADLKSAVIDINAGTMTTDKPVAIAVKGATISSDAMTMNKAGRSVLFKNNVRVNIDPAAAQGGAKNEGEAHAED